MGSESGRWLRAGEVTTTLAHERAHRRVLSDEGRRRVTGTAMDRFYRTITGRKFDLTTMKAEERAFLTEVAELYRRRPAWDEFARTWPALGRTGVWGEAVPVGSPLYRICQDLEARLGIAEGRVARPDYRDQLVDLIEERFGSRYAFCKALEIDQGHLSRVLAGKKHLAPETLFRIFEGLGVQIELVQRKGAADPLEPPFESERAAERLRNLEYRVAALRNVLAEAEDVPPEELLSVLGSPGLFEDDRTSLRPRIEAGEDFEKVVREALGKALEEKAELAKQISDEATEEKDSLLRDGDVIKVVKALFATTKEGT